MIMIILEIEYYLRTEVTSNFPSVAMFIIVDL
jgi:hypothetical protein